MTFFLELRHGEVPRIPLLGTWVNKAAQASSEARSDYTDSSCFRCFRERCCGPYTTTTTIATAHHSAANSHACLTESTPENIGLKKLPEMVLFMACISMRINTLPLALLNTQLKTITKPRRNITSDQWISPTSISGRCHTTIPIQRIRLAKSADRPTCRRGRA